VDDQLTLQVATLVGKIEYVRLRSLRLMLDPKTSHSGITAALGAIGTSGMTQACKFTSSDLLDQYAGVIQPRPRTAWLATVPSLRADRTDVL
jgi:hypothetical protein